MGMEEVRDNLFERYQKIQERYNIPPYCIFNMDESGQQIVCSPLKVVIRKGTKIVHAKQEAEQSENITIVISGNALESIILPPMVIFKGGFCLQNFKNSNFLPIQRLLSRTVVT